MPPAHFVFCCNPGWSHLRSICVFAAKIILVRRIIITVLVQNTDKIPSRVTAEVARCLEGAGAPKGEVRVVAMGPYGDHTSRNNIPAFAATWELLLSSQPVTCSLTHTTFPAASRPAVLLLDGSQQAELNAVRAIPDTPPVLLYMMGFSSGFLHIAGPARYDGSGDYLRTLTPEQLANPDSVLPNATGKVVRVPGLPPMYDWESFPQILEVSDGVMLSALSSYARFANNADGLVTCCSIDYDGQEALDAITEWIAEKDGRPTFHIGPMLHFKPGTTEFPQSVAGKHEAAAAEVVAFLDRWYERRGEHSIVYVSFGTGYWPSSMPHLEVLLKTLQKHDIPFILAHAYRRAIIPDALRAHFAGCDSALFTTWAPQETILAHPATGWFLTHGGGNSGIEAASQGVPLLGWPFTADQPMNVARQVYELDISFELIEMRCGELGLRKSYVSGKTPTGTPEAFAQELEEVLGRMKRDEGRRKRENARRIKEGMGRAWERGGSAEVALQEFLRTYAGEEAEGGREGRAERLE